MYSFGEQSTKNLKQLDCRLQEVMNEAIKYYDFSIITGYRSEKEQNRMVELKRSKLTFPNSKHNEWPSKAVDIQPYPFDWNNVTQADLYNFVYLAGLVQTIAKQKGLKLIWGGNWDGDLIIIEDQSFDDLPHFEIDED